MMPKPRFRPKSERLPTRCAVTIIAGFKCSGGVVLCADTQETISISGIPLSKRKVPKLRFHERDPIQLQMAGEAPLAVAFCGAGDGAFIDKLVDNAWRDVAYKKSCSSVWEAASAIEDSIKETYKDFGAIYQVGLCPSAELLYGVKAAGGVQLFSADGPVVNEIDEFRSGGCGYYMADFLAQRMHDKCLSAHQCAILAAYILFQAKEHVDGCGGDSHIAVLREDESCGLIGWHQLEAITKLLEYVDKESGKIILDASDLGNSDEEFAKKTQETLRWIQEVRKTRRKDLEDSLSFWRTFQQGLLGREIPTDSLGLPKPQDSEK